MIQLLGTHLYQWDLDRKVLVDESISYVHFANRYDKENALVVQPKDEDGLYVATIPNALLTTGEDILVWNWRGNRTIGALTLPVYKRNRPDDYIYEPSEVVTSEKVKEWVLEQLEQFKNQYQTDYTLLKNKPKIEGVELVGNRLINEFGITSTQNEDIDQMFV